MVTFCLYVDWATWVPGIWQVGQLVHRPGGPPRSMLKEGVERSRGPFGKEGSPRINYLQGSRVYSYATAYRLVCLIS